MKSTRLGLPLLASGQAQKEVTVNEALTLIDSASHATCIAGPLNSPPTDCRHGESFICGPEPVGAWAGRPDALATFTEGGWRFIDPFEGLKVTQVASKLTWCFSDGAWICGVHDCLEVRVGGLKVVGARGPAIPTPVGGSTVDAECRQALALVLAALSEHGLIARS